MTNTEQSPQITLSRGLMFLLALACGAVVANLYYAQTLIALISSALHLNVKLSGLIVTLTQIGYGMGLLFIAPLSDLLENRRLIITLLGLTFLSLLGIIFSANSIVFLLFCFLLGLTAVAAQVILPFVAHLTPSEKRGQVVGQVMSGLFLGIMLSRPIASFLSYIFAWQAVFIFSAIFMILLIFLLKHFFPQRKPEHNLSYGQLIASFPKVFMSYPILQRRAIYHGLLFLVLNLFWTSIATLLMGNFFHYTQEKVALFALVGAMGALTAPIAGRLADKGLTRAATGIAIVLVCTACVISQWHHGHSIIALVIAAIVLDIGAACNLVLGQRTIYALAPEIRGRLNALYVALFFMGGAIGSGLSGYLYKLGGWSAIANTGLAISVLTLLYFLTEYRQAKNTQI
ncbi:MAG: MFS transporter [Gammaproteobacteria bacterium]|nr:MFS transporter [Gammaproteobacteria bacterium]